MHIQGAIDTSVGAVQYEEQGGRSIRVYCQGERDRRVHNLMYFVSSNELESGQDNITELVFNGKWEKGATLPVALRGSSLAVVTYPTDGPRIRLYYQTDDLTIKEHCFETNHWAPGRCRVPLSLLLVAYLFCSITGDFDGGKAPGCVPINAVGCPSNVSSQSLYVFWSNTQNEIVGKTLQQDTWEPVNTVFGNLKPGTRFAVLQCDKGKEMKIFCQTADDSVEEISKDGDSWNGGSKIISVN